MGLLDIFNNLFLTSFDDYVDFFSSYIPYLVMFIFILNVLFSIFDDIIHIGGRH